MFLLICPGWLLGTFTQILYGIIDFLLKVAKMIISSRFLIKIISLEVFWCLCFKPMWTYSQPGRVKRRPLMGKIRYWYLCDLEHWSMSQISPKLLGAARNLIFTVYFSTLHLSQASPPRQKETLCCGLSVGFLWEWICCSIKKSVFLVLNGQHP